MGVSERAVKSRAPRRRLGRVVAGAAVASALLLGVGVGPVAAQPTVAVLNPGGGNAEFEGIRVVYSDGQFQIVREGAGQLYNQNASPPTYALNNTIVLAVGNPTDGGKVFVPSNIFVEGLADGVEQDGWDSIVTTQTNDTTFQSVFTATIDGRTYTLKMVATYFAPAEYFDLAFTMTVPTGNTEPVRLYFLLDTYLGGTDEGPGFVSEPEECPQNIIVGVRGPDPSVPLVEAIQYVGGTPFAGYASEDYYYVVFGDGEYGPGQMTDLPNLIDDDPTTDNGIGVNWNFGSTAGSSSSEIRMVFSENLPVNCPEPGPGPDPDPGPDTDGDGLPDIIDPDIDGDGILNEVDEDANGDGVPDEVVAAPRFTG